jgi:hypothetical protein
MWLSSRDFGKNGFTGTVPSTISKLTRLSALYVRNVPTLGPKIGRPRFMYHACSRWRE